jgi:ubiquinone/menaquinone biosynthesis C-methylase UbiE
MRRPLDSGGEKGVAMTTQPSSSREHRTTSGHDHSSSDWLDGHYQACRAEYEAQARSAGFKPGWHVLDAGCGGGNFLPLLGELVGPTGRLTALDLAPENIATVEARLIPGALDCPLDARVGSILDLPFPNGHFDAVWCANTSQYLDDAHLDLALAELRRVVRPGGLVALKEFDGSVWHISSRVPRLLARWSAQAGEGRPDAARQVVNLRTRLERVGCEAVWLRTTLIERVAPHGPGERAYIAGVLAMFARVAADLRLPAEDVAEWAHMRDLGEGCCDDPAYGYYREGTVVVVGRIPEAA